MTIQSGEESNFIAEPRLWGLSTEEARFFGGYLKNMDFVGEGALISLAALHVQKSNYASAVMILNEAMQSRFPNTQLDAAAFVAEMHMCKGGFCDRGIDLDYGSFATAKSVVCALAERGNPKALQLMISFNRLDR